MRVSVVIATDSRSASLRALLQALRYQVFDEFEVIVVRGPSPDDTARMLSEWEPWVTVIANPELNVSKARNVGIEAAAGEIVAFIDDDAVPEPRWLQQLVHAYSTDSVGGVGGLIYDATGINVQYRYSLCDRIGRPDFERAPPFDDFVRPGADPFVYLQGTNMSFRRTALQSIGGFDENMEYGYEDVDAAMRMIDRGWKLLPLDSAPVHHGLLANAFRRDKAQFTDPSTTIKGRSYFALRSGIGHRPAEEIFRSLTGQLDVLRAYVSDAEAYGRLTAEERASFVERMEQGFDDGVKLGMRRERVGRALADRDRGEFERYSVLRPPGGQLRICLVAGDYPPKRMGGIERHTFERARVLAALGHEVHVVTEAGSPYRIEFEEGVWVHRYPGGERLVPHLDAHPLKNDLAHVAVVWQAVNDLARRFPIDLVAGNAWRAEVLCCGVDPRWPTLVTVSTPQRTLASTNPAVASKPEVGWQIALEAAALQYSDQLVSVSEANLAHIREHGLAPRGLPADAVWHGIADRCAPTAAPPRNECVEVLFVGRLEPRKGVDTLIAAAAQLLRKRPQVRIRLVGADNPYAWEDPRPYAERVLEELAPETELLDRISFEGEVSQAALDELFQRCDIFCAPSRYESFGHVNVEAMMFARPVVSTRVGGIQEVVLDGETGILVPPDDASALHEALRRLVDDPALRRRMGESGRHRYEQEFTSEIGVARLLKIFRRTVERNPPQEVDEPTAEAAVRRGLAEVMARLGGIEDPDAAAAQLLDPASFPYDYRAAIEPLRSAGDRDFVTGIYRAILQRDPEPEGLDAGVATLTSGERSREDLVRAVATSDEAKLRGVDIRFLDRLQIVLPAELRRRIQDAFWREDQIFVATLMDVLRPRAEEREEKVEELLSAIANGADRHTVLRELVERDDLLGRFSTAETLHEEEFLTTADLVGRLRTLIRVDDEAFVDGIYRLLLGRHPEPAGAVSTMQRLRNASRREVIDSIAASQEAIRRGIDPVVVAAVAARLKRLNRPPRRAVERVPGARKARRVARRLLRGPRIGRDRPPSRGCEQ